MRRIICAMNVSLDGFIEGANGELDWIENWEDSYGLMEQVDTCVLGAGMYPGYEQFWSAVLAAPHAPLPFTGKPATQGEIDYAKWAHRLLGSGKRLFSESAQRHKLGLTQTRPLPWGTVELTYRLTAPS
jgi:hypothetical protein